MMFRLKACLALLTLGGILPAAMRWPHEVGSGGDSVLCTKSDESAYLGHYALDYLLTLRGEDDDLVAVRSWEDSRDRLLAALHSKLPDLARLFEGYLADLDNHDDYLRPHLWEQAPYGLVYIDDQSIVRKLPPNCYETGAEGRIRILQTVIRVKKPRLILYDYDPSIFRSLRQSAPLQFSFLLVHEWLWDFTDDVAVVRRVNRFLHSRALDRLSAKELRQSLENMGLPLSHPATVSYCARTPELRAALEQKLGRPCEDITDPGHIPLLDLSHWAIASLQEGDFTGLGRLDELVLRDNRLTYLYEDVFAGLWRLYALNLGENQLSFLPPGLFAATPNLQELRVDHNRLAFLPPEIFAGTRSLQLIDLSYNELRELPDGIFKAPASGDKLFLRLSHNHLRALPEGMPGYEQLDHLVLGGNDFSAPTRERLEAIYREKLLWE